VSVDLVDIDCSMVSGNEPAAHCCGVCTNVA
jgi:hypothetical protein